MTVCLILFNAHLYDRLDRLVASSYDNGAWEAWQYDKNGNISRHILRTARDADSDGLPDPWEFAHGISSNDAGGTQGFAGDADGDGWTNYQELLADTAADDALNHPPAGGPVGAAWFNPPVARIIFPPTNGGGQAIVKAKIWDAEGNPTQSALEWFDATASVWKVATLARIDGEPVLPGAKLATSPGGTPHTFVWNTPDLGSADVGVLLRLTAQDSAGTSISPIVPYTVNNTGDTGDTDTDGDGLPDTWEVSYGLNENDATGANGPNGDLDFDGLANLAEFAFDLNPKRPDSGSAIIGTTQTNPSDGQLYLTVTYRRRINSPGLLYRVQTTSDLTNWTSNGPNVEVVGAPIPTGDGVTEAVTVRITPPLSGLQTTKVFVRVVVAKP